MDIKANKKNECDMRIDCSTAIKYELSEFFTFTVPGAHFMKAVKNKIWDGKIRIFSLYRSTLPIGLYKHLEKFAQDRGYTVEFDESLLTYSKDEIDIDGFKEFIKTIPLPFEPRDYQIDACINAINRKRLLITSPTGSGKSLIIYLLLRYFNLTSLIVVPTVNLVNQLISDFADYSINDPDWVADTECHKIYTGQDKYTQKQVTVSTWQSIHKLEEDWYAGFDLVLVDEVHFARAKSLQTVMSKLTDCYYRFGTTATIQDSYTDKTVLQGAFGPVYSATTSKQLMDEGYLAKLKINCVVLKYDELDTKATKDLKYQEEIEWLIGNHKRNLFIRNLACKMNNNTMVLVRLIKHGKILFEMIQKQLENTNRKVFFVYGNTEADVREKVRKIVDSEKDAIIIASTIFATGVNIKNLTTIIFASPTKSKIKTLQSIGRSLRIGELGYAVLYDIVDDLSYKSHTNFALKHYINRAKTYDSEKFPYKTVTIELPPTQSPLFQ